jgi:hypothetical protein
MAKRCQAQQQLLLAAEARLLLTAASQRPLSHAADIRLRAVEHCTSTGCQQRTAPAPVSTRDLSGHATVVRKSHAAIEKHV